MLFNMGFFFTSLLLATTCAFSSCMAASTGYRSWKRENLESKVTCFLILHYFHVLSMTPAPVSHTLRGLTVSSFVDNPTSTSHSRLAPTYLAQKIP